MIEIIGHALSQWDVGRSVQITGIEADHAHFANKGDSKAVIMGVADTKAKIPDYLLQTGKQLCVYAVKDGITVESKTFYVQKRERPENYVYEDDQRNYIYELITSAETAVEDAAKAAESATAAAADADASADMAKAAADSANEAAENANAAAKAFGDIGKNFVKTVNGVAPDENGNVNVEGVSAEEKELILSLFQKAAYTADMSATFAQLAELWGIEVPDEPVVPDEPDVPVEPDEPEEPDVPVVTLTSISATYSGGDVPVGTAVTDLTGIVVTAHYSDGTSKAVTDYTLFGTIAEGSNTITVSYGGKSTTFAVTGVAEEEPETVSVRYEMPSETTFDGTNYVDTGVTLIDEDRDWTICLDYTPTAKTGKPFDISNNNTGGIYMNLRGGYFWNVCVVTTYVDIGNQIENMKVVLTHTAGSANVNVAYVTASKELSSHVFTNYEQNTANISNSKNIILGADYTKANNFAQGTMHRFVVYNGVLDEAAINEFLGVSE